MQSAKAAPLKAAPDRKTTLADLTGIEVKRVLLHQAFDVIGFGTSTSLSKHRPEHKDVGLLFTTSGVVVTWRAERMLVPLANVIVCYE